MGEVLLAAIVVLAALGGGAWLAQVVWDRDAARRGREGATTDGNVG